MENLGKTAVFPGGYGRIGEILHGQIWPDWGLNVRPTHQFFPDCLKCTLFALVLHHESGDKIYEIRCLFVAVGLNACFTVLPHWDNMS